MLTSVQVALSEVAETDGGHARKAGATPRKTYPPSDCVRGCATGAERGKQRAHSGSVGTDSLFKKKKRPSNGGTGDTRSHTRSLHSG